jgi:hypothetical protein
MRIPLQSSCVYLLFVCFLIQDSTGKGGGGGGGSSSSGRGGGSPSVSRSGAPSSGARGAVPGKVYPTVPSWSPAKNGFKTGGGVTHHRSVTAPLVGFYLGYVLSSGGSSAVDAVKNCESCGHVRDGIQACLNADVQLATGANVSIAFANDVMVDQDCLCPEVNPEIYGQCVDCLPSVPDEVRAETFSLRDDCEALASAASPGCRPLAGLLVGTLMAVLIICINPVL